MTHHGRAKINNTSEGLTITIPSKKNVLVLIILCFWLNVWFAPLSSFSFTDLKDNGETSFSKFMVVWLLFWIIYGVIVMHAILWGILGEEIIRIGPSTFLFEKSIFSIGVKKSFDRSTIQNIRYEFIDQSLFTGSRGSLFGTGPGKIAFDGGSKTYTCGLGLDNEEAKAIVELLRKYVNTTNVPLPLETT